MRAAFVYAALLACFSSAAFATPPPQRFADAAARQMSAYAEQDQFSGYVLVAHEGKPVFERGYGFADLETRRVPAGDTRFRISSISKHFTETAVLLLAAEGKLGLDDPVRKYYAAAPPAWDAITVRHLLEFRSGLFNMTNLPNYFAVAGRDPTPEKLIALVKNLPLEFAPGTRFAYNNSDPILLGYVVERVSGMGFGQFVEQRLLAQAGMAHSGFDFPKLPPELRAVGYERRNDAWQPAPVLSTELLYSAGAIYSTARDLLRWDQYLYGHSTTAHVLREAKKQLDASQPFHFGFFVEPFAGRPSEYAGGAQPGFMSFVYRFPEDRVTIVVLANAQSAPVMRMAQELARLYFSVPAPPPPARVEHTAQELDHFVGTYELYPGVRIVLTRDGSDLYLKRSGGMPPPAPTPEKLLPVGRGVFLGEDCRVEFDVREVGSASMLRYTIPRLKTERPVPRVPPAGG